MRHITSSYGDDGLVVKCVDEEIIAPKQYVIRLDKLFHEITEQHCFQERMNKEDFESFIGSILHHSFKLGDI